jgi:hypothetical protein
LPGRSLKAQIKEFVIQIVQLLVQFGVGGAAEFG